VSDRCRLFFNIGCWAAIVTALIHLAGYLSGGPQAQNDTERTLFGLLSTYKLPLPGAARTFGELMDGFSLSFSLLLALTGASGLSVVRRAGTDPLLVPALARMNAAATLVLLVISLTYWSLIPTVCVAIITLAFTVSAVSGLSPGRTTG